MKDEMKVNWRLMILALIILSILNACSGEAQGGSEVVVQPATEISLTATLPSLDDGEAFVFTSEKYKRDENCARVFDYQQTSYGQLTIGIAENMIEEIDFQALAKKVIALYRELYLNSVAPLIHPVTVFIVTDPSVGECFSTGRIVFVSPEQVNSRSFIEEVLGAGTDIHAYWVRTGLISMYLNEKPDYEALKTWYQETDDLNITGLFYAWFHEDWTTSEEREIAYMTATSLVQYAMEEENIEPNMISEKISNEIRTRWLASFGVERTVNYPYDGSFTDFSYFQSDECGFAAEADTMAFCLDRLPDQENFDEIDEAEFLINHAYHGRIALVDYIKTEAPSINHLMDGDETISIKVIKDQHVALGHVSGNSIRVHNGGEYYWILHEIVHTFNWSTPQNGSAWLTEGFAEYFGKYLPIYHQPEKKCIFNEVSGDLFNEGESYADGEINIPAGISSCHFLDADQLTATLAWYHAQGGSLDSEEEIDPRLYIDAVSFATMDRPSYGGSRGFSLAFRTGNPISDTPLVGQQGLELSVTQASSFLGWQCDLYSTDRVLDVYVNDAENGLLDRKTYSQLKGEWLTDLREKGAGIMIPAAP